MNRADKVRSQIVSLVFSGAPLDRDDVEAMIGALLRQTFGDCACNADADEPIFVLRARDTYAPETVMGWSERVSAAVGDRWPKAESAGSVADAMLAWQAVHGRKVPD